jgi:hypothetical protein
MEQSDIREGENPVAWLFPDFAALNPGYKR